MSASGAASPCWAVTHSGVRRNDAAIRRITEQAYWIPLHTYVTTYGLQKQLELPTFPDELPRFYLAKWK